VALLLVLYAVTTGLFALGYRVPDIEVFLIPLFLVCAIWIGLGFTASWEFIVAILRRVGKQDTAPLRRGLYCCLLICGAALPLYLWQAHGNQIDLSRRWEVYDYGVDVLGQPLEKNAVIVGILGEMTLLNYFQETEGMRPDLITIAADTKEERLAAVKEQMGKGQPVYLTRPLSGVEELYHLSSLGPLIRVRERPLNITTQSSHALSVPFGEGILLAGYDAESQDTHSGPRLRVSLYWESLSEIQQDNKVSLRLLDEEGHLGAVRDAFPVRDAYRTFAWRSGETVVDTHDLPILAGLPPGDYSIQVTLYDPDTLAPLETSILGNVSLGPTIGLDGAGPWDIQQQVRQNLGGRVKLLGYSKIGEEFKPGDTVPITFLWQALDVQDAEYSVLLWLENDAGAEAGRVELPLSARYPPHRWREGEVVRDWQGFLVPGNSEDGSHRLKMQVLEDGNPLPRLVGVMPTGGVIELGSMEVKGRDRSFDVPAMGHAPNAQLGDSVKLLGYDLEPTVLCPGEKLSLTLYWQGQRPMATSYTVFVHLLDEEGDIQGQRDSVPGNGDLPTTSWVEGEIIADGYEIDVDTRAPLGRYSLALGMYDASTGDRLPAIDAEGQTVGDHLVISGIEVRAD
jgi:hypothetical protein